jgi:hypothetical protein
MDSKISVAIIKKIFLAGMVLVLLGTFFSVQPVSATGGAGYALHFDGQTDYIALGTTEDVFGANWKSTKSISLWVRPMGESQICYASDVSNCDAIIVNQPHFFGIGRGIINGQDRIWIWNFDNNGMDVIDLQYEHDEWIHISIVHANGHLKAYRNGNLIKDVLSGATFTGEVTSTKLQLGAFINLPRDGTYEGLIDEVRLYSIEINRQHIVDNLRNELTLPINGLAAYYTMNYAEAGVDEKTLFDDSGMGHTGTFMDGLPYTTADGDFAAWVTPSGAFDGAIANDQTVYTDEDEVVSIILTGSSPTPGGLTFFLDPSNPPQNGVLSGTAPNLTYTPNLNFYGEDSFQFYVDDGSTVSINSTVTIHVIPVNDPPIAIDIPEVETYESTPVDLTLLGIDVDVEDVLTFEVTNLPVHGELIGLGADRTYTPDENFIGEDMFTYTVFDGTADSNLATVTITVLSVNTQYRLFLPLVLK